MTCFTNKNYGDTYLFQVLKISFKRFSSNYLKIKKKHFYNWMLYKYIKMLIDYKLMSFNIIEEASNILYNKIIICRSIKLI